MSLKEYFIDKQDAREWLPWGGLVRKNVVRNKDGSFFGVIQHGFLSKDIPAIDLPKGWSLWAEQQHSKDRDQYFLVLCWNPFWTQISKMAENTLNGHNISQERATDYFAEELGRLMELIHVADASCHILEYQEVIDFLSFSLSLGENKVTMPNIPLYLDVYLFDGIDAEFEENGLSICGKEVKVLSLSSFPRGPLLDSVRSAFSRIPFRYVRRLLAIDTENAKKEMDEYMSKWCGSRSYMKRAVRDRLLSNMNGYSGDHLIFSLSEDAYSNSIKFIHSFLDGLSIPYIMEKYNLKDVWWGSLAGCFRANIRPIIIGYEKLNDFLVLPVNEMEGGAIHV